MPAQQLSANSVYLARFDVVGTYTHRSPQFVDHVGLTSEAQPSAIRGQSVPVYDMCPPLESGHLAVDVHGTPGLTSHEVERIQRFWETYIGEHKSNQLIRGRGKAKSLSE